MYIQYVYHIYTPHVHRHHLSAHLLLTITSVYELDWLSIGVTACNQFHPLTNINSRTLSL